VSVLLGVNVDHVATVRQARLSRYPDPVEAAVLAQRAGAKAITVHLREDRRHIVDGDLFRLREATQVHLNQELAPNAEMVGLALELGPDEACLVPERRNELTTEGGLDAARLRRKLRPVIERLKSTGIVVSLFIDPEERQIEAAHDLGADFVELHTGTYANVADADLSAASGRRRPKLGSPALAELDKLRKAVDIAVASGLNVNAGHGLNYANVGPVAAIPGIKWLHIGHSIVARAIMVGIERAVREMRAAISSPDLSIIGGSADTNGPGARQDGRRRRVTIRR
jgi:pyridoxine 5-phosphate synthase